MDHNSSTPLDPRVRDAICRALDLVGNPSSVHREGRQARHLVEDARARVASLCGARADEMVFTSGGTEADCLGIVGLARVASERGLPARVLGTAIEHPAVSGALAFLAGRGVAVSLVPVSDTGVLDMDALAAACAEGAGVLALSLCNHELGTLQDVTRAAAIAHEYGVLVHCDAVQAAGKVAIDVEELGVDSLAISAHKFHGPKGVGALFVREGIALGALFAAGHQERERRPGTENVAGIAGMGEAAELALASLEHDAPRVARLAEELQHGLLRHIPGARIHGAGAARVGNTVNVGFEGALGEVVVAALDMAGFAVSTGAACTSGTVAPSAVLLGIGLPVERAREAVRISLGRDNSRSDIQSLLEVLPPIIERARQFR